MGGNTVYNKYPAARWRDATPIGNGVLGASVYGCAYDERILINHEALYENSVGKELPDISARLSEVRALMDKKDYAAAETYYSDALKKAGYDNRVGSFYPALDLRLVCDAGNAVTRYKRSLDMENGVVTVSFRDGRARIKREAFASSVDGCVAARYSSDAPFRLSLALEPHDLSDNVDCGGGKLSYTAEFHSEAFGRYVYAYCKTKGGLRYSAIVKVASGASDPESVRRSDNPNIDMIGEPDLRNFLRTGEVKNATVLLSVFEGILPAEEAVRRIDAAPSDFGALKARHTARFSALFNSMAFSVSDGAGRRSNEELLLRAYGGKVDTELIEKAAKFGRYLLISSSAGCALPANLQGLWNGDYVPAWDCAFFNNENIEMAYWQAFSGNLSGCVLPLFNLYERFLQDYRENARNLYGCRGILLPLFMDNRDGKKKNLQPHALYWTGSSAWVASVYYDYYRYTGDEEFLKKRAYPFMKEAAEFYRDFTVTENGALKFYPANSPENRANGDFRGAGELSVCVNPAMDAALLKELLTNLLASYEKCGPDTADAEEWRRMLAAIPPYGINGDGAFKEWLHDDFKDNYMHRHLSHIYPVFPGGEFTRRTEPRLFAAVRKAVEKRLAVGLRAQTGWSLAHMANIRARLGDGDGAEECLKLILRFCTGQNLFAYHNDWRNMGVTLKYVCGTDAPFQVDANMGFSAAVNEMLLYSDEKTIEALPAVPSSWKRGEARNLRARGGRTVSVAWDGDAVSVEITADRDCEVALAVGGCAEDGGFRAVALKGGVPRRFAFRKHAAESLVKKYGLQDAPAHGGLTETAAEFARIPGASETVGC
ncbi:MAG: glycoside hydrolase N-terminal domain-containing protein [Clostridiales bacterium]|jgi:alpha-L-fucosidase 2|nr:glycoside hydrolase N-terminal domain-containing protein [Clostridiales bacterium]